MKLAVIPARGGSKRIPRKNIKAFAGRPMIAWTIAALKDSGCFDRILVSTDDDEIAAVARGEGAEVPFLRPAHLADDHAATAPVIAHAIDAVAAAGTAPEFVCCAYATAPFLDPADIRDGLALLMDSGADYAFSATGYGFPIQRALRLRPDGGVEMFQPEYFATRSQDLEPSFHDAGQFYWGLPQAFREGRPFFTPRARPVLLPRWRVQDIDTPEDWERAELMFEALKRRTGAAS